MFVKKSNLFNGTYYWRVNFFEEYSFCDLSAYFLILLAAEHMCEWWWLFASQCQESACLWALLSAEGRIWSDRQQTVCCLAVRRILPWHNALSHTYIYTRTHTHTQEIPIIAAYYKDDQPARPVNFSTSLSPLTHTHTYRAHHLWLSVSRTYSWSTWRCQRGADQ